jgi:hypothetical protein
LFEKDTLREGLSHLLLCPLGVAERKEIQRDVERSPAVLRKLLDGTAVTVHRFDKYFRAPSIRPCWNITSAPW